MRSRRGFFQQPKVRSFINAPLLVFTYLCIWDCAGKRNLLRVTGAGLSCSAGPQVSHRGSVGKAIHLRTAQGIVGHCCEEKGRALQRVSPE